MYVMRRQLIKDGEVVIDVQRQVEGKTSSCIKANFSLGREFVTKLLEYFTLIARKE